MTLTRWSPTRDLLSEEFNRLNRMLSSFWNDTTPETSLFKGEWSPAVDISEDKDAYYLHFELPGLTKEDVKVNYEDGVLTVRGEKKAEQKEETKNYHRIERCFGMFERSFRVPSKILDNKIDAKFKNGILEVTLPKAEDAKPKEIEVKIS